ncbi:PEP-CTERM sorting domain-containing protein [Luteolibacter sp. SL250]|uniref:PEP-CTERM sorting domain-containing protein n=1 Tax=Luteolibacter sp. SL250 TaxID=2995170 RepID=UPI00226E16CC|nr:PEP-CTERM sorting domain-containing protein [Luteolibacter sp. SL250]WAC20782.1 PEP-CTERM sorting domain-containing protein [Luteolibacter sp. SL250]
MKPICSAGIFMLAMSALSQAATYSFTTSAEYDANFREVVSGGSIGHNAGGYVSNTGVNQTVVVAYDTDGAGPGTTLYPVTLGTTLSMSADVTMNEAGSFGIFFSGVGGGTTYLALFNITTGGDQFRFFSGGSLATGAAGTQDFTDNSTNPMNLGESGNISASFEVLAVDGVRISMTANGQTFSRDYTGITLPPQVEIAFRTYNPAGATLGTQIDNLVVTDPIPEPSAIGLAALGMVGLAARRRR